jgi:hypothetical protein
VIWEHWASLVTDINGGKGYTGIHQFCLHTAHYTEKALKVKREVKIHYFSLASAAAKTNRRATTVQNTINFSSDHTTLP